MDTYKRVDPRKNGSLRMWGIMTYDFDDRALVPEHIWEGTRSREPTVSLRRQPSRRKQAVRTNGFLYREEEGHGDDSDDEQHEIAYSTDRLVAARESLARRSNNELKELAHYFRPPPAVGLCLKAMCDVLGYGHNLAWPSIRRVVENNGSELLRDLATFQVAHVSIQDLGYYHSHYLSQRSFNCHEMISVSSLCAQITELVLALMEAARIRLESLPKGQGGWSADGKAPPSPKSLQRAVQTLGKISINHLREIACFSSAPAHTRLLLQAVCDVGGFGERLPPRAIKQRLLTPVKCQRFLRDLAAVEAHRLTREDVERVERLYVRDSQFDVAAMKRYSNSVCGVLVEWLLLLLGANKQVAAKLLSPRRSRPRTAAPTGRQAVEQYWQEHAIQGKRAARFASEVDKQMFVAKQKLANIKKEVVSSLLHLNNPPRDVMICVVALADVLNLLEDVLNEEDAPTAPSAFWHAARVRLQRNATRIIEIMRDCDIERVSEASLARYDAWYLSHPSMCVENMKCKSRDAGLVVDWLHAITQAARIRLGHIAEQRKQAAIAEANKVTKRSSFGRIVLQHKIPVTDLSTQDGAELKRKKIPSKKKAFSQKLDFSHVQPRVPRVLDGLLDTADMKLVAVTTPLIAGMLKLENPPVAIVVCMLTLADLLGLVDDLTLNGVATNMLQNGQSYAVWWNLCARLERVSSIVGLMQEFDVGRVSEERLARLEHACVKGGPLDIHSMRVVSRDAAHVAEWIQDTVIAARLVKTHPEQIQPRAMAWESHDVGTAGSSSKGWSFSSSATFASGKAKRNRR